MSLDLGHSKRYIQSIPSGKTLSSLSEFLFICEALGVLLKDFFDEKQTEPILVSKLHSFVHNMKSDYLEAPIHVAKQLVKSD